MTTIWFSSDLHLGHENIISFCNRPFTNAREMDEALLDYHNMFVKPSDHWYNLGDVTMRRGGRQDQEWFINLIRKFNGHKRLLLGNHDHFAPEVYLRAGFEKIFATWRGFEGFILSHIPIHPASMGNAGANVHGHIHNNQGGDFPPVMHINKRTQEVILKPYINISVEVTDYHPITLEQVHERIKKAKGERGEGMTWVGGLRGGKGAER